jgi:hypothetical protein
MAYGRVRAGAFTAMSSLEQAGEGSLERRLHLLTSRLLPHANIRYNHLAFSNTCPVYP